MEELLIVMRSNSQQKLRRTEPDFMKPCEFQFASQIVLKKREMFSGSELDTLTSLCSGIDLDLDAYASSIDKSGDPALLAAALKCISMCNLKQAKYITVNLNDEKKESAEFKNFIPSGRPQLSFLLHLKPSQLRISWVFLILCKKLVRKFAHESEKRKSAMFALDLLAMMDVYIDPYVSVLSGVSIVYRTMSKLVEDTKEYTGAEKTRRNSTFKQICTIQKTCVECVSDSTTVSNIIAEAHIPDDPFDLPVKFVHAKSYHISPRYTKLARTTLDQRFTELQLMIDPVVPSATLFGRDFRMRHQADVLRLFEGGNCGSGSDMSNEALASHYSRLVQNFSLSSLINIHGCVEISEPVPLKTNYAETKEVETEGGNTSDESFERVTESGSRRHLLTDVSAKLLKKQSSTLARIQVVPDSSMKQVIAPPKQHVMVPKFQPRSAEEEKRLKKTIDEEIKRDLSATARIKKSTSHGMHVDATISLTTSMIELFSKPSIACVTFECGKYKTDESAQKLFVQVFAPFDSFQRSKGKTGKPSSKYHVVFFACETKRGFLLSLEIFPAATIKLEPAIEISRNSFAATELKAKKTKFLDTAKQAKFGESNVGTKIVQMFMQIKDSKITMPVLYNHVCKMIAKITKSAPKSTPKHPVEIEAAKRTPVEMTTDKNAIYTAKSSEHIPVVSADVIKRTKKASEIGLKQVRLKLNDKVLWKRSYVHNDSSEVDAKYSESKTSAGLMDKVAESELHVIPEIDDELSGSVFPRHSSSKCSKRSCRTPQPLSKLVNLDDYYLGSE